VVVSGSEFISKAPRKEIDSFKENMGLKSDNEED